MPNSIVFKMDDPAELKAIAGFHEAYRSHCSASKINHVKFLGPEDRFSFTCQRTNTCCRNFSDGERIILDPYDVLRLSRKKGITTGKFMSKYATLTLDNETHIPIALLNYSGREHKNKCHFLRSYGCSVYQDRPLRCRLYPLGRLSSRDKTFYMLINNCPCGDKLSSNEWTVSDWLSESECKSYLEFENVSNGILEDCDMEIYKALSPEIKLEFGRMLYDIDRLINSFDRETHPTGNQEIMTCLKRWAEEFLAANGCLKDHEASPQPVEVCSLP